MTIQERNTLALNYSKLLHKLIHNNFKNNKYYEHVELFQIGFLAILKALNDWKKELVMSTELDKFIATYIIHAIRWQLSIEKQQHDIDFTALDTEDNPIIPSFNVVTIQNILKKLMKHCLTHEEISLIDLYYGLTGPSHSLSELASSRNCSRENIRLKIQAAIRKLKYGNSNKTKLSIKQELLKELGKL